MDAQTMALLQVALQRFAKTLGPGPEPQPASPEAVGRVAEAARGVAALLGPLHPDERRMALHAANEMFYMPDNEPAFGAKLGNAIIEVAPALALFMQLQAQAQASVPPAVPPAAPPEDSGSEAKTTFRQYVDTGSTRPPDETDVFMWCVGHAHLPIPAIEEMAKHLISQAPDQETQQLMQETWDEAVKST